MVAFNFLTGGISTLLVAFFLLACGFFNTVAAEDVLAFKSRPDLFAPTFTLEISDTRKISPGYIFVGPYQESQNPGPHIYDNKGELVWSGWGSSGPGNAHGMHVCQYKGEDHLCFFQGNQQKGYCRGHGVIMDNQYRIVRSVQPGGGMASSDMHEFQLIDDGKTALMTVYQQRQFDMSPWNIITGIGWVMESIFQEIDVETGQVLFEWRSLDHVDPSLSYTLPDHTDTSGTGLDPSSPWDYFHINSIDKNAEGDYLISSRHTSAVYKISGKDGSIMWRLNGQNPSFTNENFDFSQQHDARWLFENTTHTMLSLYNNGYNGFNQTHEFSSGMIILIDYEEKKATQVRDYVPPGKEMLSSSQGNMQLLPGYNVFMGWGSNAYVSEHDFDGNLALWGYFSKDPGFMNYRAQKFKWEGNPTDAPALWSFSKSTEPYSPTTFYASWNGATRVKYWRFYGSMNATGPYTLLNQVLKTGFETAYTELNYYPWTHVEAVGAKGKTLGKSTNRFTFVPSPEVQGHCTDESCGNAATYGFPDEANPNPRPLIPPMGVSTVPWVDPENPDKLFDWGQSGGLYNQPEEEGEEEPSYSGSVYDYTNWAVGAVVMLVGAIGLQVVVHLCRKARQTPPPTQRRGSLDIVQDVMAERAEQAEQEAEEEEEEQEAKSSGSRDGRQPLWQWQTSE